MTIAERWGGRIGTGLALPVLVLASVVVLWIPFGRWKRTIGWSSGEEPTPGAVHIALQIAGRVERAAARIPLPTKCLPRAVATSWLLRRKRIPHTLVFAARPKDLRGGADALHSWIEVGGTTVIGELRGPWIETLRLGDERPSGRSDQAVG